MAARAECRRRQAQPTARAGCKIEGWQEARPGRDDSPRHAERRPQGPGEAPSRHSAGSAAKRRAPQARRRLAGRRHRDASRRHASPRHCRGRAAAIVAPAGSAPIRKRPSQMSPAAGAAARGRPRFSRRRRSRVAPRVDHRPRQRRAEAVLHEPVEERRARASISGSARCRRWRRAGCAAHRWLRRGRRRWRSRDRARSSPGAASRAWRADQRARRSRRARCVRRGLPRQRSCVARCRCPAGRRRSAHARPLVVCVDIGRIVDPADAALARKSRSAARRVPSSGRSDPDPPVDTGRRRHAGKAAARRRAPARISDRLDLVVERVAGQHAVGAFRRRGLGEQPVARLARGGRQCRSRASRRSSAWSDASMPCARHSAADRSRLLGRLRRAAHDRPSPRRAASPARCGRDDPSGGRAAPRVAAAGDGGHDRGRPRKLELSRKCCRGSMPLRTALSTRPAPVPA